MIKKIRNSNFEIRNYKAFTLIELILYMGLFSILILIFSDIFITSLNVKTEAESNALVNQDARYILAKLNNDINNSNSIISPALGSTSNTIGLILYGEPITYKLENENLIFTDSLANEYVLNSFNTRITNLAFTRLGNDGGKNTFRVNLTIESKALVNNIPEIINLETAIGLR